MDIFKHLLDCYKQEEWRCAATTPLDKSVFVSATRCHRTRYQGGLESIHLLCRARRALGLDIRYAVQASMISTCEGKLNDAMMTLLEINNQENLGLLTPDIIKSICIMADGDLIMQLLQLGPEELTMTKHVASTVLRCICNSRRFIEPIELLEALERLMMWEKEGLMIHTAEFRGWLPNPLARSLRGDEIGTAHNRTESGMGSC